MAFARNNCNFLATCCMHSHNYCLDECDLFAGPAAALLESSSYKIEMDFALSKTTKPAISTSTKSGSAPDSNVHKLVIINRKNSQFTTKVAPTTSLVDDDTNVKNKKKHGYKRKAIVSHNNDNDLDDFDFGDQDIPCISAKKSSSSAMVNLVVIDDSDDSDASGEHSRTRVNVLKPDHMVDRSQETTEVIS